jgi:hypothetical protein
MLTLRGLSELTTPIERIGGSAVWSATTPVSAPRFNFFLLLLRIIKVKVELDRDQRDGANSRHEGAPIGVVICRP